MTPVDPQHARPGRTTGAWGRFRRWRRSRPFWGGLLTVLAGVELFVSGKLTLAGLSLAVGPTGFLSWIIPVGLVTCGLLIWFSPSQRLFYAIIAAVTAVYSLKGLNLGGFFLGMLLGMVGSALAFAWTPAAQPAPAGRDEFAGPEAVPAPRPAADDRTLVDELLPARDEGPPPGPPGVRHRALGFTAIGLTLAGLLTVQGPTPVRAAPTCPPTASATLSGRPAAPSPTSTGPASAGPTPAPVSPSPADPTPASTGRTRGSGNLIGDILDGIGDLLTGGRRTPAEPTPAPSGSPTARTSPGPGATSRTPTGSPKPGDPEGGSATVGDPAPSTTAGRPSACPAPPRPTTDPTPAPPRSARVAPGAPLPRIAADPGQPRVAEQPSKLTGTKVTMTGLRFDGIVELPTASGKLRALKFSMRRAVTDDFLLRAGGPAGTTAGYATDRLTVQGDVDFYATRFVGRLLGIKITLTPDLPFPDGIPITSPIPITFTDPVIDLAYVSSNTLTARPALRLALT
ncbi:DUF6114 domain-containing protein [Micromonospora siamensis]|uniref:Uncharacterized protein n=1 Tax=Micromonospora siamensis TaxID=299152 RepID=A0A1C5GSA5_9ACTN|nr:DUF6114 domain-containing protein [Micromonospora siamensis]SCG36437.1 hypothetical protein GA0074704_0373 [Micromonospora siamensis]